MTEEQQKKAQCTRAKNKLVKQMEQKGVTVLNAFHDGKWREDLFVTSNGEMYRWGKQSGFSPKATMHQVGVGTTSKGYHLYSYDTGNEGEKKSGLVHRCVWFTFWQAYKEGKCDILPKFFGFIPDAYTGDIEGHHIDRNIDNNAIDNIEFLPANLHNRLHEFAYKADYDELKKYKEEHRDEYIDFLEKSAKEVNENTLINIPVIGESASITKHNFSWHHALTDRAIEILSSEYKKDPSYVKALDEGKKLIASNQIMDVEIWLEDGKPKGRILRLRYEEFQNHKDLFNELITFSRKS